MSLGVLNQSIVELHKNMQPRDWDPDEKLERAARKEKVRQRVEANKVMNQGYENDLAKAKQELEDFNKPEITPMTIDAIHNAVEQAVEGFNFDNTDQYEFEFGMDYDGKVHVESVGLQCAYELTDQIVTKVCNLFKEADCPEDDNSQVNTQTVAEKII